mgnify:CR=1 FL=1
MILRHRVIGFSIWYCCWTSYHGNTEGTSRKSGRRGSRDEHDALITALDNCGMYRNGHLAEISDVQFQSPWYLAASVLFLSPPLTPLST